MRTSWTRVASTAAVLALSLGAVVATSGTAAAAGCRTSYKTYTAVAAGSSGSKAGAVQCLLTRAGYATTVDRSFSKADAKRLGTFQSAVGLPGTGEASGQTWAALIAFGSRPTLEPGSEGADVTRLQLSLRALGHDELPGTTTYGSLTTKAVKSLQGALGWKRTGVADDRVWAALQAGGQEPATEDTGTAGATALAYAEKQLGEDYEYGAAGPDTWDCSGLTMKAWASAGVTLPHSASAQAKLGAKVAKADLQPGDLVFFYSPISHVGIYAGDGEVVHASRPGKPVAVIKISSMPYQSARRPG